MEANLRDYRAIEAHYGPGQPQTSERLESADGRYNLVGTASFWAALKNDAPGEPNGWKVHVSVNPDQLEKAWQVASDYLMQEGVGQFKVANPETRDNFSDPNNPQAGKMMTIYPYTGGPNMAEVLRGLEERLEANNIAPGPTVQHDKPVKGSRFSSYRNDAFDAEYVRANGGDVSEFEGYVKLTHEELGRLAEQGVSPDVIYNPAGKEDTLAHINVANPRAGFAPTPPEERHPVHNFLAEAVGEENVFGVSLSDDGKFYTGIDARISPTALGNAGLNMEKVSITGTKHQHIVSFGEDALPEHVLGAKAQEQARHPLHQAIAGSIGDENILDFSMGDDGQIAMLVPPNFSRQSLADVGIDTSKVQRETPTAAAHILRIEQEALPDEMKSALQAENIGASVREMIGQANEQEAAAVQRPPSTRAR